VPRHYLRHSTNPFTAHTYPLEKTVTIITSSTNNFYLFGNIELNLGDYFDSDTGVATISLGQQIFYEASTAPVPGSETLAVLYKCVPFLSIGIVYDNTQVYQGIPNTFQIGSYNYSYNGYFYERIFVNYKQQSLRECSSCFPTYGGYPSTMGQGDFIGVIFPPLQTSVDTLSLYLPNADIMSATLILQYSLQQLQNGGGEGSFVWNSLSAFYE